MFTLNEQTKNLMLTICEQMVVYLNYTKNIFCIYKLYKIFILNVTN